MVSPVSVENFLGIGNYLLIGCDENFARHFLLSGYGVSLLGKEELSKTIQSTNSNFNFSVIMVDEYWSDADFGHLLTILSNATGVNRVLFSSKVSGDEKNQIYITDFLRKMNDLGYARNSYESDFFKSEFISLIKGSDSISSLKCECDFFLNRMSILEIIKYIRPNESVCVIGECSAEISDFLVKNIIINKADYYSDLSCFLNEISSENLITKDISNLRLEYYDCIIVDDYENNLVDFKSLLPIANNLCPGGRLIFKSLNFSPEQIDEYFEIEVAYHTLNKNAWCEHFGCIEIVGDIDSLYVVMKSPLVENESFVFREKTYLYSTPPKHLINFAANYINPWLVKAMIEFPTRNLNNNALERYANRIINNYKESTPDYGSALAIIGYQTIESSNSRTEIIDKINGYIEKVSALDNITAHQTRWLISLSVLGAELLKIDGDNVSALKLYRVATSFQYKDFSPTIGTKVLQAYYNIAVINYCCGNKEEASQSLDKALDESIEILNVSLPELLGEKSAPLTFTIYIYHDILDWIIKLSNFKRHINDRVGLVPKLNSQTWSGILKERMNAINEMSFMIASRDNTINAQGNLLEERLQGVNEMSEVINAQKTMIEERWEAMQAMEKLIDARWNAMQEMEEMIKERDATIEQLKKH